jgi:thymidylate synthase
VITIVSETIGEAWLGIARRILETGERASYDTLPITEVAGVALEVTHPDPADAIIARRADPERLEWMRRNFVEPDPVAELGDARSYASRLRDYAGAARDQVDWVVQRLRNDPASRSATITTFEPLLDTSYIPCVSMLDFWMPAGALDLVVYAHSIDFGTKGYGNLAQLAALQHEVATLLARPVGTLSFIVKSAHIYDTELEGMERVLAAVPAR